MKKIIRSILLLALPIISFWGCTETMKDMNIDSKGVTNNSGLGFDVVEQAYFSNMMTNIFQCTTSWEYQVQENLNTDEFAGYTMGAGFGDPDNSDYNWHDSWNGWAFTVANINFGNFAQLRLVTSSGQVCSSYYAAGQIMFVLSTLGVVDDFGPFPYLDFGVGISPAWENLDTIYLKGFIPDLIAAKDTLESYIKNKRSSPLATQGADISSFNGNLTKWAKLANTLILRLSLRISMVDKTDANTFAAAAILDPIGFLDATTGDWSLNVSPGNKNGLSNPFSFVSLSWDNCVMGADMQSFLTGMKDPRESKYFTATTDSVTLSKGITFAGVRAGSSNNFSHYGKYSLVNAPDTFVLVSSSESYFLLAEAYLRGIGVSASSAQAQTYYNNGITQSMSNIKIPAATISSYLADAVDAPAPYVDANYPIYNNTPSSTIVPQWDATGTTNLEQIITQKWIANFPRGVEGWAEFRRTGFPQLMLPYNMTIGASFDGSIAKGHFARRMPFPSAMSSVSPTQYSAAVSSYLGGNDNGSVPLWWDPTSTKK